MPHTDAFDPWHDRVDALIPDLPPHHRTALTEYSFGMALARACGLTAVAGCLAAFLSVPVVAHAQRGPARSEFDSTLCFGPLVRWSAAGHRDNRLLLALDPTCLTDRVRVLCAAVLYRGTGMPVAWAVQAADDKGSWNAIWVDLLGKHKAELGDGRTVLILTDRGLESPELFRAITASGWHPLMRVKAAGKFRPEGWHMGHAMAGFAPGVGRRWAGAGVAYPTGSRLPCTLLASWDAGHAEPWLVLTDQAGNAANPAWYAWRMSIDQGFRAVKRGQWDWQRTRMADADGGRRLGGPAVGGAGRGDGVDRRGRGGGGGGGGRAARRATGAATAEPDPRGATAAVRGRGEPSPGAGRPYTAARMDANAVGIRPRNRGHAGPMLTSTCKGLGVQVVRRGGQSVKVIMTVVDEDMAVASDVAAGQRNYAPLLANVPPRVSEVKEVVTDKAPTVTNGSGIAWAGVGNADPRSVKPKGAGWRVP